MMYSLYLLIYLFGILFILLLAFVFALRCFYFYRKNIDPLSALTARPNSILAALHDAKDRENSTWT
jgi:hypothetical protein